MEINFRKSALSTDLQDQAYIKKKEQQSWTVQQFFLYLEQKSCFIYLSE